MPLSDNTKTSMFTNREAIPRQQANGSNLTNQSRDHSQSRPERRGSQSRSDNRQPLGLSTVNRRPDTASLKVAVPNTTGPEKPTNLKHQTSQSTLDEFENRHTENLVKQEASQPPRSRTSYSVWNANDDDSTEITTGEMGWDFDAEYSGEATARWAPNVLNRAAGANWQQESDAGRAILGQSPKYATISINDHANRATGDDESLIGIGIDDEEEDEYAENVKNLRDETPSRATKLPTLNPAARPHKALGQGKKQVTVVDGNDKTMVRTRDERDSSPLPGQETSILGGINQQPSLQSNSLSRHITYRQQVEFIPARQDVPQTSLLARIAPAKVSGHLESAEEGLPSEAKMQPISGPTKGSHVDLDCDMDDLKRKDYADLDRISFLTNPREPEPPAAVDVNGTPLRIPQRLTNLSKMRPKDQESLFRTLTDDDNEQVGQWFVQTFQDSLAKLMERRLERRKIALKFENEVKRRELHVKVKIGDVEEELRGLRKGGGELIGGRSVKGVGGTPKGT